MNIATVLFTYNRSDHTRKVLEALSRNTVLPDKFYIFQDGLKSEEHRTEWEKVNLLIKEVNFCPIELNVSKYNKGLANSIVSGVNYVFEKYDAVIVLEDDCVPAADFINFMQQCLKKYREDKRVYSVTGYGWPIELSGNQYDVYGCGRISTWGWGTWKDRWEQREVDSGILERIKNDQSKSRYLAMWGNDCEQMFLDRIIGCNNSWAIYWGLYVIENKGICINPYKSLIQNIGMDGSGTHSGITDRYQVELEEELQSEFALPDHIDILHTVEVAFADFLGSHTAANTDELSKQHILIYGMGNFFYQYEKEINDSYYIEAFVDRYKNGWYAGKKVIRMNQISEYNYGKIMIMVQDIQQCICIVKELIERGIDAEKIVLGQNCYGELSKSIDQIIVVSDGNLMLKFGEISIKVRSSDEFKSACTIFLNQIYNYSVNNFMRDIIFDIGMNIGDSTVFFANQDHVDKVYAYEPYKEPFSVAEENLGKYICTGKVEIANYGISNKNTIRTIEGGEQIVVKRVTEIFEPIIASFPNHNMILKLNCEGDEEGILQDLLHSKLLEKMKLIMMEWHHKGNDTILDYLREAGFSWWCIDKSKNISIVHAYKN